MNLFIITNNPSRPSFRQRIEVYLETLCRGGINCEVAKFPSGELARLKFFKRAAAFDGVLLHKKCLNFFDAAYLRQYSKKIIYDFDDAIMYSPETPESSMTSHFRLFRRTSKLADMIIAGNSYLAEHAQRFNDNVHILPTGLDTKAYSLPVKSEDSSKIRLVWIGSKSTLRYLAEIKPVLEEVGTKYPNVVLRIICDDFFDLKNMKVEKCRWSLESQVKDLITTDIALAPMPNNRFTRGKCGFKALQYAAASLPTITSPVGVNLRYIVDGVTGYHALDAQEWINKIDSLVGNAELRKKMGHAAKEQVIKFDDGVIGKRLNDLISEFLKKPLGSKIGMETDRICVPLILRRDAPKVSVCIPTYNRKHYLRETLESIFAQAYHDYEIVIVDDGSTDGTEEMLKELGFPFTYYWQENAGDAAARNRLIELARGRYISFIDSDDLLMPDALERMVNAMESEGEDVIVYGSYFRVDQNGNIYGKCRRKLHSGNITEPLFKTILVHACGSMFPKKILKRALVFDTSLKVCSDYDLWLSLSLNYRFIALDYPTFKRRRHPTNLSVPSFENCLTELQVLKRFYYEKGGKDLIPEETAMKVFSKEGRRAGCCAIKEGLYDQAYELTRQSFRQHPNFKSLMSWMRASMVKRLVSS